MIELALQKIHHQNGAVLGHEVLARKTTVQGVLGPGVFMAGATDEDWERLDAEVIGLVLARAHELPARGILFINLSPASLLNLLHLNRLCQLVSGLSLSVCFEIPELSPLQGVDLEERLVMIRRHGIAVAIDDYGQDSADSARLKRHAWDFCKIDLPALARSINLDWVIEARDHCTRCGTGLILEKVEQEHLLCEALLPLTGAARQGYGLSMPFLLPAAALAAS